MISEEIMLQDIKSKKLIKKLRIYIKNDKNSPLTDIIISSFDL